MALYTPHALFTVITSDGITLLHFGDQQASAETSQAKLETQGPDGTI